MSAINIFVTCILIGLAGCSPEMPMLKATPNRVLYTSADISKAAPSPSDSISQIRAGGSLFSPNIRLILADGEKRKIPKSSVWGYTDEKGNVWRHYRKEFFQVRSVGDVVEYRRIEPRQVPAGERQYVTVHKPVTSYSKTLDSRIVATRKRALRDAAPETE